jgi:hypothetical protein
MKLPQNNTPFIPTIGLTGIVLMTLHLTGFITGWGWPVLYILLILSSTGNEAYKR